MSGRTLIDSVDATVSAGELLAVVGPNGAGKSSLLGLLAGDLTPTDGAVRLLGEPIPHDPSTLARRRAILRQDTRVRFDYTVAEIVAMGRHCYRETPAEEREEVARALSLTSTGHLAGRIVTTLSGGEQALVSLARVLAQGTPVLLLDEPTAALDLRHQHAVLATVRRQADSGQAVVIVLHDLSLAGAYADTVLLLHRGRRVASGAPLDVLTPDLIHEVFEHRVAVVAHPDDGSPAVLARRHPRMTDGAVEATQAVPSRRQAATNKAVTAAPGHLVPGKHAAAPHTER